MKRALVLVGFVFAATFLHGQDCGTVATTEQLEFMEEIQRSDIKNGRVVEEFLQAEIPIKAHIVRKSDGTGGLTIQQLNAAIENVNNYYENANMIFFLDGEINYIDNDDFYDLDSEQEQAIAGSNDVSGVINIYFSNTLSSGNPLCGYAYFPPSTDRVFMANDCTTSGNTLPHELGHYFTLFHTHGKTNNGGTDELVNGSNCGIAGDNICDTPADPNLSGRVSNSCQYTGTLKDANGDLYAPQVENIMSYAPGQCRDLFSTGQYTRIRNGFEGGRNYLKYKVEGFQARFISSSRKTCVGNSITFKSLTESASSWSWQFPGGEPEISSRETPTIVYDEPGVYNVYFTAASSGGASDNLDRVSYIEVIDPLEGAIEDTVNLSFSTKLPMGWSLENRDRSYTFEIHDFGDDNFSLFMNNYDYSSNTPNSKDEIVSPFFSNVGVKSYKVSFKYAYSYYPSDIVDSEFKKRRTDTLKVALNYGCSGSENNIILWEKGGEELATVLPVSEAFYPDSHSDWKNVEIEVQVAEENVYQRVSLVSVSNNGNNLFIDDLKIQPDESLEVPTFFRRSTTAEDFFTFRWSDNSTNEIAYVLERSKNGEEFVEIARLDPNTTIYVDETAEEGIDYVYRLYASGRNGNRSVFSDEVEVLAIIAELGDASVIDIYPNPNSGVFNVSNTENQELDFSLIDLGGKVVRRGKLKADSNTILDLSTLRDGLYYLNIFGQSFKKSFKVLKTE